MAKFQKGHSGNPAGRKPGIRNRRTQLSQLLEPHAEQLVNKAVELALSGDINALKLCLDRLIPKATSQPIQLKLDECDFEKIDNLSAIGRMIMLSIASGHILPEEGQRLMSIVDAQRKLIEHVDMGRKLDEISEYISSNGKL
ncbi:hypothetical protein FOLKNPGA_03450 [Legionella sp. PC1000]|uniref:DUF5681 domain-containing protein n=1 Tax=Legionella sp. PC1000 TaxID=2746060 RepID=UPI0015FC6C4B|nr:DUF5681 domain-containing protein [Legionella sp. PC1000]QLZ70636.1 hypothetical protein FOLKNPGA_03450 [Legionella sp. PC1000]